MKRANQTEIARRLGLSQRAVSKALRDEPGVSDQTRELVKKTASELSYHGDRLARCLLGGKSHIVGVLLPTFSGPFFGELLDGAETTFGERGFKAMLSRWERGAYTDEKEIRWLLQYKVDAFLVFPHTALPEQRRFYFDLVANGQKLVFVNEPAPCPGACGIYSDDRRGLRLAMEHLLRLGHRRVVYAGVELQVSGTSLLRSNAYAEAARELGGFEPLTLSPDGRLRLHAFLEANPDVTAFLCYDDGGAVKVIQALESLGYEVPRDFSVVGFGDNVAQVDFLRVPLTTVSQDAWNLGSKAAGLCLSLIAGEPFLGDVVTETRLVERRSTGPARLIRPI